MNNKEQFECNLNIVKKPGAPVRTRITASIIIARLLGWTCISMKGCWTAPDTNLTEYIEGHCQRFVEFQADCGIPPGVPDHCKEDEAWEMKHYQAIPNIRDDLSQRILIEEFLAKKNMYPMFNGITYRNLNRGEWYIANNAGDTMLPGSFNDVPDALEAAAMHYHEKHYAR